MTRIHAPASGGLPAYVAAGPLALVDVGDAWAALGMPSGWGRLVVEAMRDQAGPVFDDVAWSRLVWIVPSAAGTDWPDLTADGITWHRRGEKLLVPGVPGHLGTEWLRPPVDLSLTDPGALRDAVEMVTGPLDTESGRGPLVACHFCGSPTRDGQVVSELHSLSGPDRARHACPACWRRIQAGGTGRHLRPVRDAREAQ